jgi:P-type Cu+ transporter
LKHNIISIDIPITLGIIALFLHSSWEVFNGQGIGFMDSLAGLLFFLLIGKWYQSKTYQALSFERDYKSYFPVAVTRINSDGTEQIIPISQLKKDDVIMVRNQELIPADAILVRGSGNIDYSFVTGESIPVPRQKGELIYAGGRQVGSAVELKVEKEVEQSYLTRLWNQKSEKQDHGHLDAIINRVSRWFTLAVIVLAFAGLFFWWHVSGMATAVFVFSSVLIIACPCALALTVPFTLGSTMRVFGRKGFYIKNTHVIEQLHRTDTIVFDKTGTITQSRKMHIEFHGDVLTHEEKVLIRSLVCHSSHPLSAALNDYLGDVPRFSPEGYQEVPGMGITGQIKWKRVNVGNRIFVEGIPDDSATIGSRVFIGIAGEVKGYFTIGNQYREGFDQVSSSLASLFDLHLLSGDNDAEKNNLEKLLGEHAALHFNQSPLQKREYVVNLKQQGKKVLMIGDGLNDAGALSESHAGITIADDAFSFSPACDAILEATRFKHLHRFIGFTHTSFRVIRASFAISFIYNIIGLSFALSAALSPLVAAILMPLSSITIVAFATFSINILGNRKLKIENTRSRQ